MKTICIGNSLILLSEIEAVEVNEKENVEYSTIIISTKSNNNYYFRKDKEQAVGLFDIIKNAIEEL